jgi:sugar lactone lactonase YvrE
LKIVFYLIRTLWHWVSSIALLTSSLLALGSLSSINKQAAIVHRVPDLSSIPDIVVLASNLPGPDDLLVTADNSIYISDVVDGSIKRLAPNGTLQVVVSGLKDPEGMVMLPDGALLIVEQGTNRLVEFNFKTKKLTPFMPLTNTSGQLGVDGIALDTHRADRASIIIPDSPNNTLLRAGLDGETVTSIAAGFARPTGAWVENDGNILVVDENGGALKRVHPDGKIDILARGFSLPDDVVEDKAGNIFFNSIGDNAVYEIMAGTNKSFVLASGLAGPQGLALDVSGNLVVSEPGNYRLVKIVIH